MKKIKYTLNIVPIVLLMLINSCDLDTVPTTSVDSGKVYSDLKNVEYVINGTWSYIWETYNTIASPGWSTLLLVNDCMGNDVVEIGQYGYSGVYQYTAMNSGTSVHVINIWNLAYKAIDNMNNVIAKIDEVKDTNQELRARLKAQAYAFRGYMYLNLATSYSHSFFYNPNQECVPIYTEPTTTETIGKSKSTLAEVYKQAEEDLLEGYETIGEYSRSAKYKIDKNVISGLLARLYLQTGNWKGAQEYAEKAHIGYAWMSKSDYLTGFNDMANAEWIWGQGSSTNQTTSSSSFDYKDVYSTSSDYYSMMADPYFMELFNNDEGDTRFQLFEWQTSKRGEGYLMYKKFLFKGDGTADVVVMRKAEMILIEAEALAEQDQLTEAIAKLNELRVARGAQRPDLAPVSKEFLIEEILKERRKELFGEGFALADIKRRQKKVERTEYPSGEKIPGTTIDKKGHRTVKLSDGTDFTVNSPHYIFTIPAAEYTNNPNL